jgi:hypothetical protein
LKKFTNKITRDTEFCSIQCGELADRCKVAPEYCIVGQNFTAIEQPMPIADRVRAEWNAFADEDSILIERELEGGGIVDRACEWMFEHSDRVSFTIGAVIVGLAVVWFIHHRLVP